MAKKCKNITIKQGLDDWVMTYGDMMSLLLTFFVLIVSFSSMQETKFEQAVSSLHEAFGVLEKAESVIVLEQPVVPNHEPQEEEAEMLFEVRSVERLILEEGLDKEVEVKITEDGVLFRLNSEFAFVSGGAELKEESKAVLDKMSSFFQKFPYKIRTDSFSAFSCSACSLAVGSFSTALSKGSFPSAGRSCLSSFRKTSTRRFLARPSAVALSAMGWYSPSPVAEIRSGGKPIP